MLRSATKHPPGRNSRHKKKWPDVRNIKWTKINMAAHVIRWQPFYILGEGKGGLQDPIIFLSTMIKSKHLLSWEHWRSFHPKSYKLKQKKKMPFWKFLLNYSLSAGSPSFINYLFSIFWQWINLLSLWWRSNCLFSQKNED